MKNKNTNNESKNNHSSLWIIICGIVILVIVLGFICKDTILYQIDYNVRTKTLLNAYSNRTIATNKDDEGYYVGKNIALKLADVSKEDDKIKVNVSLKVNKSDANKEFVFTHGIYIYDNNNNFIVANDNFLIPKFANENDCGILDIDKGLKTTIPTYTVGLAKELGIPQKGLLDISAKYPLLLEKVQFEDVYANLVYTFDIPNNVDVSTLNIRLNDPMLFDVKTHPLNNDLYLYDNFTEWQFTENVN